MTPGVGEPCVPAGCVGSPAAVQVYSIDPVAWKGKAKLPVPGRLVQSAAG